MRPTQSPPDHICLLISVVFDQFLQKTCPPSQLPPKSHLRPLVASLDLGAQLCFTPRLYPSSSTTTHLTTPISLPPALPSHRPFRPTLLSGCPLDSYRPCHRALFHLPVLYCTYHSLFYAFWGWQPVALRKTSLSRFQKGQRHMAIRFAFRPHGLILRVSCCSIILLMVRQSCRIQGSSFPSRLLSYWRQYSSRQPESNEHSI